MDAGLAWGTIGMGSTAFGLGCSSSGWLGSIRLTAQGLILSRSLCSVQDIPHHDPGRRTKDDELNATEQNQHPAIAKPPPFVRQRAASHAGAHRQLPTLKAALRARNAKHPEKKPAVDQKIAAAYRPDEVASVRPITPKTGTSPPLSSGVRQ